MTDDITDEEWEGSDDYYDYDDNLPCGCCACCGCDCPYDDPDDYDELDD